MKIETRGLRRPFGGQVAPGGADLNAAEGGEEHAAIGVTGGFSAVGNLLSSKENSLLMTDLSNAIMA